MKKGNSYLCVIAAALLWGCMGILVRTMEKSGFDSMEVTAFRAFVTAAIMLAGMFIFNRNALKIRLRDTWCFLGTGIFSVIFFNVCYFSCMNYTTLSTAAILLYTAPAFVIVMSFFLFKEKINGRKIGALFMAFIGCVLVSGGFGGGSISAAGLLTGLGAGFGYALYSIFSRYALQKGYSTYTITTYTFLFAFLSSIPLVNGQHFLNCVRAEAAGLPFDVFMVVLTTVIAYLLYTKGLTGMENGRASVVASVEPVMASVVGMILYQEAMSPMGIVGMILVLGSCLLVA